MRRILSVPCGTMVNRKSRFTEGTPLLFSRQSSTTFGYSSWVTLEDDVEGRGGDVPAAQMDQIAKAIASDLKVKLAAKAETLSKELVNVQQLISRLIGEP